MMRWIGTRRIVKHGNSLYVRIDPQWELKAGDWVEVEIRPSPTEVHEHGHSIIDTGILDEQRRS